MPDIYSHGLRLRMSSGYGRHVSDAAFGFTKSQKHDVTYNYVDLLIGYHMRLGALTAKPFAGSSMNAHDFSIPDAGSAVSGRTFGATGALEFWLNLGDTGWTSLDLNYTTAHDTGSIRWRAGWRALPTLSIGPEVRYDINAEDDAGRAGLFARYEWFGGEVSAAAGVSGQMTGGLSDGLEPYVTINYLTQF